MAIVNAGFKFSEDSPHIDVAPPGLGEHNEEILASLGFDAAQRREILAGNDPGQKLRNSPCNPLRVRAACVCTRLHDQHRDGPGARRFPGPANTAGYSTAGIRRARA